MSFCRWSSDNFACDLYAYESDAGYMIHVASNRVVGDVPPLDWETEDPGVFYTAYKAQHAFLDSATREPIGLAHDGETFVFDSLEEFRDCFVMLREAGYHFPQGLIESIEEEMREEKEDAGIGETQTADTDGVVGVRSPTDDLGSVSGGE